MTAGGWIAEVRYNSTGSRVILILLAGSKASSLYSLAGMAGLIQVIDRRLRVFASHATTIVFGRRKTTRGNCYACGNKIDLHKGPHPNYLALPTASDSLDASHPLKEHL
jgi:hypothetical protein